jgi:hypothetical protein
MTAKELSRFFKHDDKVARDIEITSGNFATGGSSRKMARPAPTRPASAWQLKL